MARPLDCACALLLSRSRVAARFLAGVYRKALRETGCEPPGGPRAVAARCGGLWGCGADQGSGGGAGLGACGDALGGGDLELAPSTAPGRPARGARLRRRCPG